MGDADALTDARARARAARDGARDARLAQALDYASALEFTLAYGLVGEYPREEAERFVGWLRSGYAEGLAMRSSVREVVEAAYASAERDQRS